MVLNSDSKEWIEGIMDRIDLLMGELDMPDKFLHKKIGMGQRTVNYYLNKGRKPNLEFVVKILEAFPEVNSEWLLIGRGKMFKSKNDIETSSILLEDIKKLTIENYELRKENGVLREKSSESSPEKNVG